MSVAEMKVKAVNHLIQLQSEKAIENILMQLEKLAKEEMDSKAKHIDTVFEEAIAQYGNTLKKLAE